MESGFPWLSLVTWMPLAGALILLALPKTRIAWIKYFANAWAAGCFLVSLPLLMYDKALGGVQFIEDHQWVPLLGARYTLGVDGISVVLVLLTTLLGAIATLSSWNYIKKRDKEFYFFILLMQTAMLGVFVAMDLFLFYVFWEVTLVPMYFLIAIWGDERRLYAAIKFFLYTLVGSLVMLLSIFKLYFLTTDPATILNIGAVQASASTLAGANAGMQELLNSAVRAMQQGQPTFNILALQALGSAKLGPALPLVPLGLQIWLFAGFFMGFAFKVPMFPFHTWLPDAHVEAPTAASVILAGVLLKLGGYGFVRFSLPMLPDASRDPRVLRVVIALAIIGIIYGALCSMFYIVRAGDMKKLVAYSSVSHMGMVILGLFALNPNGINGAVLQMVNHGISTSALFLIVGILYERRHTRLVSEYGGLSHVMPAFAAVFLIMVLSSIGLPLLNGFIGEFLVLRGAFEANPWWAAGGLVGVILGAAYLLWLYQRVMFGTVEREVNRALPDLTAREWAYMAPLVVLVFWIGVYPKPFLDYFARPAQMIAYQVWHQSGGEPRYAPTPEAQEQLTLERLNRAVDASPALIVAPVPDVSPGGGVEP
jgi:NADH-quinone oxidoreductase subunit M